MGTPTVFASSFGFGPNYLMNPKPGEKRTFFTSLRKSNPVNDSVPYIIDVLPDFKRPIEQSFSASYFGKYGNKMNFPHMKMPSLVGGFVGAKSQSAREDCGKLGDILASAFHQIFDNSMSTSEVFANSFAFIKDNCSPKSYTKSENSLSGSANDSSMTSPKIESQVSPSGFQHKNSSLKEKACESLLKKPCMEVPGEDKEKPPMKKPKLNVQACRSPRRKRRGRRKKREETVQCITPLVSPGYDPAKASFENVDETECEIKLFNRFAPLESEPSFQMWSESPNEMETSDSPLLDMLSEMHLDDFEVDFDNASPAVDIYNVHSYSSDSPLSCNSSIAFILSGNDDVLASDSEDGSFASDVDDFQWQSFKADFEFFQDHIPMQNIVVGSCNLSDLHFEADLEVFDNDIFLNDLEHQTDNSSEQRLKEVNLRWNQIIGNQGERQKTTKVCFAPDNCLTSVLYIPSGPEECQARKSPWDQCYMDRCRFEKKIRELEPIISLCLTPQHRKSVFQRLYGSDELN